MKIFIISPNAERMFTEEHRNALNAVGGVTVFGEIKPFDQLTELYDGDEPRIVAVDPDFSDWKFPNEVIDKIPSLKAIVLQTTSFSWLDIQYAAKKGIPVVNLRGFSSIAVAEWVVMLTLALARRLPVVVKDGWKLDYEKHRGFELRGKKAGVIGLGRIGTAVAENLKGLGMNVQYWSRNSEDERFDKVELDELMRSSDVIVSAVAHNDETEGLLSDEAVRCMKPTALLIDITHPIYSTELVLQLAADGKIGGYAFEDEKNAFGHYAGNVWNGPALGWCTNESMSKNAQQWVEAIVTAAGGEYPTRVN
ncbi:MAG TPA: NAD(P)-dependent oxidoreductase [Candidatus Saccharimonadales bacterium]|nr:NAD(P)-dependent oxidoreductase [Candidatus Saccharimonadales bacterium]